MKTYLVDWGKNPNGGRFAIIQAPSLREATIAADDIGSPFRIAELIIPKLDGDGSRYLEIEQPTDPYCGPNIADAAEWKSGFDCLFG
jgi:hypothetical protein